MKTVMVMPSDNVPNPAEILKRPYHRIVVSDESGSFGAEIAEFPGCLAVGDTAAEALANLEDVAEGWLLGAIEHKQPIPAPFEEPEHSGKLALRLPKSLHTKIAVAAERDGVSINTFIVTTLAMQVGAAEAKAAIRAAPQIFNFTTTIAATQSQIINVANVPNGTSYTISSPMVSIPTAGALVNPLTKDSKWKLSNG
jgi:antitoxin HicB